MQKLIFFLSFILMANLLKASDLPKLNLKLGEKYVVETIYHEDTTQTHDRTLFDKKQFEFKAIRFDKASGIYDVELVLKYYMHVSQKQIPNGEWREDEVYETGYSSTYRNPIVYLNMHQMLIKFKLSVNNQTSSFDFSEFSKHKSPEGLSLSLGEWDQKNIEREISALFFDTGKSHSYWSHEMDIRSNYQVVSENNRMLNIQVEKNKEPVKKGEPTSRYENYKRTILLDQTSGLIKHDQLSFNWTFMGKTRIIRSQRLFSWSGDPFELEQKTGASTYEKTMIENPNVSLRILVQDSSEYKQHIYLTFYDFNSYTSKSYRLKKDQNGYFIFQGNLSKPIEIQIHFQPESILPFQPIALYLSPGDQMDVEIKRETDPDRLIFKGLGAFENQTLQQNQKLNIVLKPRLGTTNLKDMAIGRDSSLHALYKHYTTLNPEFNLNRRANYQYLFSLAGRNTSDSISQSSLPFCNTPVVRNNIYQQFLNNQALSIIWKYGTHSTNNNTLNDYFEKRYTIGQIVLPEPIRSEYCARTVENALTGNKWEKAKLLYERYKQDYAKTARAKQIEGLFQKMNAIAPGSTFPLDELTDIEGNTISLRKIKNKPILINVSIIMAATNIPGVINRWPQDYEWIKDQLKDIVMVRLVIGKKEQLAPLKAAIVGIPDEQTVFLDIEDVVFGRNYLTTILYRNTYLLGKKGIIRSSNREINDSELQRVIAEVQKNDLFSFVTQSFIYQIIMVLFSMFGGILLTFIIYRRITRKKQQRTELLRKMRELELSVIRTQMNPHFMYNCLNSIQNLVHKNKNEEAHLYLSKFASLVRQTLNNSKKEEVSLDKELDFIREYIELEQLRFDFDFKLDIGNGVNLNNIFVPPMLLQPFVENSILHGLMAKKYDRLLEIRISKDQSKIELIIQDNGIGRKAAEKSGGNGQGILLSTNRLALLSEKTGIKYDLETDDLYDEAQNPCGTRVSISFTEED